MEFAGQFPPAWGAQGAFSFSLCWLKFVENLNCHLILFMFLWPPGTVAIHWFDIIQEKVVKKSFRFMSRTMIPFIVKIFVIIRNVPFDSWRRQTDIYQSNSLEEQPQNHSSVNPRAIGEGDQVLPCVQRLQKLEKLLEELNNKRHEIPMEKEQMLQQSMDRIKCVETDLEKTKRASIYGCSEI